MFLFIWKFIITFAFVHTHTHTCFAVVAQMVEHQLPKLRVVGSIPIYRSNLTSLTCTEKPRITNLPGLFYTHT